MASESEWVYRESVSIGKALTREKKRERWESWLKRGLEARAMADFEEAEGRDVSRDREWLERSFVEACGSDPDQVLVRVADLLFDVDVIDADEDAA